MTDLKVGELFILGFQGPVVPDWLRSFERRFGLGGVILFDYDYKAKSYENNVRSREQVATLCLELGSMASRPLVFVDQEGGKVRRLKDRLGFAPLPSAKDFALLPERERHDVLTKSFTEMRELGIHFDFAPVVDVDYNPANPDIGAVLRSYSGAPDVVRRNAEIVGEVGAKVGLGLCLKHYPGLGGATVNSHLELTDLSETIRQEQLDLFTSLCSSMPGEAILVSHGIVKQWDPERPVSMSREALTDLRRRVPRALLVSDDLQMQGLQQVLPTGDACREGFAAGLDLLCIGNNLMREEADLPGIAEDLQRAIAVSGALSARLTESLERIGERKRKFAKG